MEHKIISADSHFTEPADLWVNHMEPAFKDRAPHVEHHETTDVYVCEGTEMFDLGLIHGVRYGSAERKDGTRYAEFPSEAFDPDERLKDQDVDGVDGEVIYPTIAMRMFSTPDVEFQKACFRAYNNWVADFCSRHPKRLKGVACISLDDIEGAVLELHRIRELGLPTAMVAVSPDETLPYHHDSYHPFWAAAEETDTPISVHQATERRPKGLPDPTEHVFLNVTVQRVIVGMLYGGLFDRFPKLRVVSAENDAGWAGNIVERMDYNFFKFRERNRANGAVHERLPSSYLGGNISMTFMRDLSAMNNVSVVPADSLVWGSDFPHLVSTWPKSQEVIAEHKKGLTDEEADKIFRSNAMRLYGF